MNPTGEDRVLSFIDELDRNRRAIEVRDKIKETDSYKRKILNQNKANAKEDAMGYIFKTTFKNAIPLDANVIDDNRVDSTMRDFLNRRAANSSSDLYVREAIKNGNGTIKALVESVDRLIDREFFEQTVKLPKLKHDELNWEFNDKLPELDKLYQDANLDTVSSHIKDNVKSAMESEMEKVKLRREQEQELKDEMKQNNDLVSEEAIDRYLTLYGNKTRGSKVYTPTLFESVLVHRFNNLPSDTDYQREVCLNDAILEYTILNVAKALKCENFNMHTVNELAKEYATGKVPFNPQGVELMNEEAKDNNIIKRIKNIITGGNQKISFEPIFKRYFGKRMSEPEIAELHSIMKGIFESRNMLTIPKLTKWLNKNSNKIDNKEFNAMITELKETVQGDAVTESFANITDQAAELLLEDASSDIKNEIQKVKEAVDKCEEQLKQASIILGEESGKMSEDNKTDWSRLNKALNDVVQPYNEIVKLTSNYLRKLLLISGTGEKMKTVKMALAFVSVGRRIEKLNANINRIYGAVTAATDGKIKLNPSLKSSMDKANELYTRMSQQASNN